MAEGEIEIVNNEAAHRYEARVDGVLALVQYRRQGERIVFLHTEVPEVLEGRGIGSALARHVLDDAREQGLTVVPRCPFIAEYIRRHPDYLPLVEPSERARLG
jgi:predicted GNAT family acetyltransferase